MDTNWNDSAPIYRQLRDRVVAMILEGVLNDGDPLPSVRSVAAEYRLNPLTVLKGYQQLVDENLVEKRRGRGMFVTEGARRALLKDERQLFLDEEWPKIAGRIQRLARLPMRGLWGRTRCAWQYLPAGRYLRGEEFSALQLPDRWRLRRAAALGGRARDGPLQLCLSAAPGWD